MKQPIHRITPDNPPPTLWIWHSEDKDWFTPRYYSSGYFKGNDHLTHYCLSVDKPTGVPDAPTPPDAVPELPPAVDETALAEMMEKGKKAWADVPDASKWVEEMRGNTPAPTPPADSPSELVTCPVCKGYGCDPLTSTEQDHYPCANCNMTGKIPRSATQPSSAPQPSPSPGLREAIIKAAAPYLTIDGTCLQGIIAVADAAVEREQQSHNSDRIDAKYYHDMCDRIWAALGKVNGPITEPCDVILAKERDALAAKVAGLEQTSGELCEKCGWRMKFPEDKCRCELESDLAAAREGKQLACDKANIESIRADEAEMRLAAANAKVEELEREWYILRAWGETPTIIESFIKQQQMRIYAAQDLESDLAAARERVKELEALLLAAEKYVPENAWMGDILNKPMDEVRLITQIRAALGREESK